LPSPESPSPPRALRFTWPLQLLLLVVAAVFALLFHLSLPARFPGEDHYRAAALHLEQHALPGDAVLLFPWWTERARLFLPEGLPVIGYLDSDKADLARYGRIWVLGQPSLPRAAPEVFEQRFLPGRTRLSQTFTFGPLELTLYQNERARPVLFTAPEAVHRGEAVEVYVEDLGQRVDCPRRGDTYRCPGAPAVYVRRQWHEVFYQPRRCVYMHPPGGNARLVAEFGSVPSGDRLLLEAGVIWEHAVKKDPRVTTTYVRLENAATGALLAEIALPPGLEDFQRADIRGEQLPREVPLRVSVQSQTAEYRDICVDLTVFGARSEP
jgi:hypothetical protein